jgi:hypothetical protein
MAKLNEVGKILLAFSIYSICYLLGEMQTVVWMTYSDSTHFSDKLSYKILCISSYGLKDMIYTRFA